MARATRSLAGGAVVETRLCARLLGIKLLVVDGVVTLWPAEAARPAAVVVDPGGLEAAQHRLDGTAERLRRLSDRRR